MFTVSDTVDPERLRAAIPAAIGRAAEAMLEPTFGEFAGLSAVKRLAAEAGSWPRSPRTGNGARASDTRSSSAAAPAAAPFTHVLALPRRSSRPEAPLAAEAGARWTDLASALHAASEREGPDPALWRDIDAAAHRVAEAEERLWSALGSNS